MSLAQQQQTGTQQQAQDQGDKAMQRWWALELSPILVFDRNRGHVTSFLLGIHLVYFALAVDKGFLLLLSQLNTPLLLSLYS
jgi:hypothetical protein